LSSHEQPTINPPAEDVLNASLEADLNPALLLVGIGLALTCGIVFVVRLRRARSGNAGHSHDTVEVFQGPCSDPGCRERASQSCSYRDASGRRCDTDWCGAHIKVIGGATYCRRHFAIAKALNQTEGSVLQVKRQPPLGDRAMSLLDLIRHSVDPEITRLLAEAAASHPGVEVAAQKSVQEVHDNGKLIAWQVSWGLHNSRGYLLRLSIRVGVPEPPLVQVIVANETVFQSVPYWIRRRLVGEPALASDKTAFFADLLRAVQQAAHHKLPALKSQVEYESQKFGSTTVRRY
jgi:hypothetical protein